MASLQRVLIMTTLQEAPAERIKVQRIRSRHTDKQPNRQTKQRTTNPRNQRKRKPKILDENEEQENETGDGELPPKNKKIIAQQCQKTEKR